MIKGWKLLYVFGLVSGWMISTHSWANETTSNGSVQQAMETLRQEAPGVLFYELGTSVSRIWGVPFAYGASPEQTAQGFLARHAGIFGGNDSEFALEDIHDAMSGAFSILHYQQTWNGLLVDNGYLTLMVRNTPDFPLVLASSNVQRIYNRVNTKPEIPAKLALRAINKYKPGLKDFTNPELVLYMHEASARLAWSFYGDNLDPVFPERYLIFVDALTNQVLEWRNQVYHTDVVGQVQGWATPGLLPDQANNPETLTPLAGILVNLVGGSSVYAGIDGNYTLPFLGTTNVTIQTDLRGRWARAVNQAGASLTLQQTVTPPGPANFIFNTDMAELNTAQVNGFLKTQEVHDFVRAISATYPGVDIQIPCNVNLAQTCNAYYSNSTINFYRSGGGCPNTAFSTVVYHEYGHFVISRGHANATGDYHEGVADVTAAFLPNDPCLGRDFRGQGTGCLRNANNNVQYPCSGEAHACGQVISGAFWHTLDAMKQRYSGNQAFALEKTRSWYLSSILERPSGINPGITIDLLELDDDDGNIYNGTPHYTQINQGFTQHNMAAPQIVFLTIAPVTIPGQMVVPPDPTSQSRPGSLPDALPFEIRVQNNAAQLDPNKVYLHYSLSGGAFQRITLAPAGNNLFRAIVPIPPCGAGVRYYFEAYDTQNRTTRYPSSTTENLQFMVADGTITTFTDTFETNLGWTVQNTNLTAGAWTRANPNGTTLNGQQANPENDSDDAGTFCFFTGQGSVGGAVGDQDVDGGPTTLISPVIDLSGSNAIIEYSLWYYNDDGDDPFVVEVSNNNGATWQRVETIMFSSGMNSWRRMSFIVGNYVTPTAQVRVRFQAIDNPNNSITEAAIDNFMVKKLNCEN
jgi:hypothetical protein